MQQMDVSNRVFDVRCEVGDSSAAIRPRQMVVDPADQEFLRRQFH